MRFFGSRGFPGSWAVPGSRSALALDPVSRADLARIALGGLSGITIVFILQTIGMSDASSADANLIVAAYPVITILAEQAGPKRRPDDTGSSGDSGCPGGALRRLAGAAISIAGVYIVIGAVGQGFAGGSDDAAAAVAAPGNRLLGNILILILIAGFAFALYNVLTKDTVARYSVFTVVYWQTLFGAGGLALASLAEIPSWHLSGKQTLGTAAYLGLFCSVAACLLYSYGLTHLPAGAAANLINLQSAFGFALAALFLGETVTLAQVAGGAVIIAGVSLGSQTGSTRSEILCSGH